MLNIFKKRLRCGACGAKLDELTHELRLGTSEGVVDIHICDQCAAFFDKSAEVLMKKQGGDDE